MACRFQGWLQVADKATLELQRSINVKKQQRRFRRRKKEYENTANVWRPYFCVLLVPERTLRHSVTENKATQTKGRSLHELRLRLERGRRLGQDSQAPSPVTEEEEDSELSETTSLRDDRLLSRCCSNASSQTPHGINEDPPKRHTIGFAVAPDVDYSSTPVSSHEQSPVGTPTKSMETPTPSRLANFFSKRSLKNVALKRTKSVTKLERKRCALDADMVSPTHLRGSRSHESLLQSSPSILGTVDLSAGDVQVSSVHDSLLDQNYCFQLSSRDGTTYYSCQTSEERDKWIRNLRQTILPNQDQQKRTEKSLNVWLLEAKGISGKKRYFCELCLDKTLYARTSSKLKNELCFWGEHFEFNNLPNLDTITVNLYREADKKKRRDKNILIGSAVIHVNSINNHHLTEKWYPVFSEKSCSGKECPSLRIKSRFLNITILPMDLYNDFLEYLKTDYKTMCEILEPSISVRTKEDIATSMIYIMEKENIAKKFLTDIVMSDIEKIEDEHLMFRGNSTATKAIEAYMKLMGEKYLQDTLGEVIRSLIASSEDCEVDPIKVTSNTVLQKHQTNLMNYVEMVWNRITTSASVFPIELREIFSECRSRLAKKGKEEELCDNLISASVFLRFLCPAILSPSLFNLTQEYPQGKTARKLTLIAKSVQTFANFTRFGGKESFMEFMNEFLEREWTSMKSFLREISSPVVSQHPSVMEFDGHIDEGRELALLHSLLVDCVCKITDKQASEKVEKLQNVLDGISAALTQPSLFRQMSSPVPPSPSGGSVLSSNSLTTQSNCSNSTNQQSSTIPRSYLSGSNQQPANTLNTTDDYVLLSALRTERSPSKEKGSHVVQRHSLDNERESTKGNQSCYRQSASAGTHHSSRLYSTRRSFSATPNRVTSKGNDFRYPRRRLWKHNEDNSDTSEQKNSRTEPSIHLSLDCHAYSPTDSLSSKSTINSPRLAAPLAFNNPMYQHRSFSYINKRKSSPMSSFSSDSDEEIAVIGRSCLGSAGSEPALALSSRRCCTSSSSTDTNSCESPPPSTRPSRHRSLKCMDEAHHLLKCHDREHVQPSRCSSENCNFDPKGHPVHRSSTDSGLHKSFRSKVKFYHHASYSSCAIQDRRADHRFTDATQKNIIEEYERQVQQLRVLMEELQAKLTEAEKKLNSQENRTEMAIADWKKRMEKEEERLKSQQEEKDQQMKSIITRLIVVEEELRKEQKEMQQLIIDKQKIIDDQEKKIQSLDATNTHLLTVLSRLKGCGSLNGRNGSTSPLKNNFVNRDPLYKSSSC